MPTHHRTCNLCEAMCGLEIEFEGNQVLSIKGDKQDPFSKGYICPKAVALQDIYTDPDRLKRPVKRTENGWTEISWKEAFDQVATGLKSVQNKYGHDSVGIYQGNPTVHNLGSMMFASGFTRALKTKNKFSATSVDQLPHHMVSQFMFGHLLLLPVPDIDRTDFFLVLGANPMASNGSIMSAAGMPHRIKALQERGGKVVVIDPRKTETAEKSDRHYFIHPGTDAYLLAGIIRGLFKQNLIADLPEYYKNFDQLEGLFKEFDPEIVEKITGVAAGDIRQIAKDFSDAESACCYGRMGVSTQQHGTLCQYFIYLINILTGNFDRTGGFMLTKPAVDVVKATGSKGTAAKFGRWRSRVRNLPEFGGELPVAALAEEILTAGEGQIKAMVVSAGNPVLSTPNGGQLESAFESLEFMVSIDIYINETSKYADIILPPATGLETSHYDLVFNNLAVRNVAKYSPRLFNPEKSGMEDWKIYKELQRRLRKPTFKQRLFNLFLSPEFLLNQGLKRGPYKGLSLSKLKNHPHGLDLGVLKARMPERLFTSDKKIDLAPEMFKEAVQGLSLKNHENGKLRLIGRRHLRSNNSWMHNSERLVKGGDRCTAMINPSDAEKAGVVNGQKIEVRSRVGSITLKAEVTEKIMQGVVSIPHGWGHNREGVKWKTAKANPGSSINELTDDLLVDDLSGNAAFSGVEVELIG
ncbi:MAG: molybdopterin-dependent oxidoreductase [Cyclobacteriaceae bacterium]